jgi:hypothetical protein
MEKQSSHPKLPEDRMSHILKYTIAFSLALGIPVIAAAQQSTPGKTYYNLQCQTVIGPRSDLSQSASSSVSLTANRPDLKARGYVRTGGGCQQFMKDGTDAIFGHIERSIPSGDDGWACIIRDVNGQPGRYFVEASMVACRTAVDYTPVDPPATFATVDGNDMIVARRGVSFFKPLDYDYRICNTDTKDLVIKWTDASNNDLNSSPNKSSPLSPGSCIEFGNATSKDRATSIALQAQVLDHRQTGYFARYPKGTFAEIGRTDFATPGNPNLPAPMSRPSDAVAQAVICGPALAGPKKAAGDTIFVKQCQLRVPDWGHYRICFDSKYVELNDGSLTAWPATALPMVLDKSVIGTPSPSNSEDPIRNWIFPNNCRDYYDVQSAFVLVGYRPDDSNFAPGQIYDPNKISKIHMWIAPIK